MPIPNVGIEIFHHITVLFMHVSFTFSVSLSVIFFVDHNMKKCFISEYKFILI
jgi:hypothetical protein